MDASLGGMTYTLRRYSVTQDGREHGARRLDKVPAKAALFMVRAWQANPGNEGDRIDMFSTKGHIVRGWDWDCDSGRWEMTVRDE